MNSRRNFIKNSGIAAMGAGMINQKKKESMNFIHHVLFWAKNPEKRKVWENKNVISYGRKIIHPYLRNSLIINIFVTHFMGMLSFYQSNNKS